MNPKTRHLLDRRALPFLLTVEGATDAGADAGGAGAAPAEPAADAAPAVDATDSDAAAAEPGADGATPKDGDAEDTDEADLLADAKADKPKDGDEAKPEGEKKEGEDGDAAEPEPFNLTAPEGFETIDADALAAASPILRELGVTDDAQAQEVVGKFAPIVQGMVERALTASQESLVTAIAERNAAWAEEARNDPEIGGNPDRFAENMTHAARFRDAMGTEALRKFFKESGVGNHPEMVRMFVKAGKLIGEGTIHRSDTTAPVRPKTFAEKAYGPEFQPKG